MLIDLNDPILGLNNFEDIFIGEPGYSMLMGGRCSLWAQKWCKHYW